MGKGQGGRWGFRVFKSKKLLAEATNVNESLSEELQGARSEIEHLRGKLSELGGLEIADIEKQIERLRSQAENDQARIVESKHVAELELDKVHQRLAEARQQIVETDDAIVLQEVGVYQYRHPLDSSVDYKEELKRVQTQLKDLVKQKRAVMATENFTFNNSVSKGRKFVNDFSKVMLRAYNAEAENCVRVLKAGTLSSAEKRLNKAVDVIERLGKMIDMHIAPQYHQLRLRELSLTADYLAKVQEEKEAARAERERLREEEKARAEYRREQERLLKERAHYENALAALKAKGDEVGAAEITAKISDVDTAIEGIKTREAHIRAGYVYVISNLGALGPKMVKIGMTRRLNPMDRITELGDASVPFRYDIHALFFSQDAVGIETALHRALEARRVNRVNLRREFFYATPSEVRELLKEHAGNMLDFVEEPEASEYWQSRGGSSRNSADEDPSATFAVTTIV